MSAAVPISDGTISLVAARKQKQLEALAARVAALIEDGELDLARAELAAVSTTKSETFWLARRLRSEAKAKPDDEDLNLCARVSMALAVAIRAPDKPKTRSTLRRAAHDLAELVDAAEGIGLSRVPDLPHVDRRQRGKELVGALSKVAFQMALKGRPENAALVAFTTAIRMLGRPTPADRDAHVAALAMKLARYMRRDAPTLEGFAKIVLQACGLTREEAKSLFR